LKHQEKTQPHDGGLMAELALSFGNHLSFHNMLFLQTFIDVANLFDICPYIALVLIDELFICVERE